ncbi:MAG: CPBP family intramembrane metalloprotease [Lachnospiraceae bacterium]|nr:CPBP family intramembrane metalloprotease [Lachnospiraceae bacterium]
MKEGLINKIYACIIAVSALILVIAIQTGLLFAFGDIENSPMKKGLFYVAYSGISIIIFGLMYRFMQNNLNGHFEVREYSGKRMSALTIVIVGFGIQAFGYGVLNLIYLVASETELFKAYAEMMDGISGSGTTPLIILYSIILAPVCEELIFRGVVMNGFRFGFKDSTANILAAMMFGIFHGNLIQGIYAFLFGMMLGYVKLKRNRIGDSILMHLVINLTGLSIVPIFATFINAFTNPVVAYVTVAVVGLIICVMWIAKERVEKEDVLNLE